jgi:hypothetical protein
MHLQHGISKEMKRDSILEKEISNKRKRQEWVSGEWG